MIEKKIIAQLDNAERKAWDSLSRYKFQMFGYWAALWVTLNRISGLRRPNPWLGIVKHAREAMKSYSECDQEERKDG
jgi:hypothetical protein